MMDLQELRIQRTPVTPNSKCESCVHYDGNAQSKGGACEVGTAPAMCGNGLDRKYGYAPLAELGPDEIDDLATPCVNGNVGTMNEHGDMEPQIQMKRVTLGDEDMTIAERIRGIVESNTQKSLAMWHAQGEVSLHCGHKLAEEYLEKQLPIAYVVAKSLYDLHFAPRKQRKYDLEDVLDFLKSRGMDVGDDSYEAAGIQKGKPPLFVGGQKPDMRGTQDMHGNTRKAFRPFVKRQ